MEEDHESTGEAERASEVGESAGSDDDGSSKAEKKEFLPMFNYRHQMDRDAVQSLLAKMDSEEELKAAAAGKTKKKKKKKDLLANVLGKKPKKASKKRKARASATKDSATSYYRSKKHKGSDSSVPGGDDDDLILYVDEKKAHLRKKGGAATVDSVVLSVLESDEEDEDELEVSTPAMWEPSVMESMRILRQNQEMLSEIQQQLVSKEGGATSSPSASPIQAALANSSVILGVQCPFTKSIIRFKVLRDQPLSRVMTTYTQKMAGELEKYYKENHIPKEDRALAFKFDGLPIDTNRQTPQDLAMGDNDVMQISLPVATTRVDILKELAEDADLQELVKHIAPTVDEEEPETRFRPASVTTAAPSPAEEVQVDGDYIMLRVRPANNPDDVEKFKIRKSDQLGKLINAYCTKKKLKPESVLLTFDGLPIESTQTPEDLDMDDDDLIDAEPK